MDAGLPHGPAAPSAWRSPEVGVQFTPYVLTPEQVAPTPPAERLDLPAVRLMIAILEEALATYQRCAAGGRDRGRAMRDVERWLSSDDASWLFSFASICEVLGVRPAQVRDDIERWRTSQDGSALLRHRYPYRRVARTHPATRRAHHDAETAAGGHAGAGRPRRTRGYE